MSIQANDPALYPSRAPKEEPLQPEVSRPFYFEDSQVVLQVEGQTYKIHRYFLTRESEFFKDLFSLPQPGNSESPSVEGSDNNPIKVPGTPTKEFENLLRFFYFGMHNDYAPSMADWISLLSISTRLIFEKVRERAIKEITARLDQYDVEQWLKHAYRRIVTRNDLITYQEALKISLSMAVMLMRAREQYWKDPYIIINITMDSPHHPRNIGQPVNDTVWPRGPPDSIIDSEISVMESASIETGPPKTEPNTGQ
ncbi:hypothetical protein BJV77DRAFT_988233 [Russula vinacea]|nr:hypothetical protein BJV77DRAFT_988233 [Russula vinacea]